MSEYQYYEFRAIDRPLGQKEISELRALSTRAEIAPTSFTNTYHWGDFKGDPAKMMARYFDAFVYVANWGTHRFMVRIPRGILEAEAAETYCDGETLSLKAKPEHLVLEFASQDEGGRDEWTDGEEWMPALISVRAELMRGDTRALYLGWLASMRSGDGDDGDAEDDDRLEPAVPPGLAGLSEALRSLAGFLRVDDALLEVAAVASAGGPPAGPSRADLARWVKGLPAADKDEALTRLLGGDGDPLLRSELLKRFRVATSTVRGKAVPDSGRRTVAQLLAARDALVAEKRRKAAERAAKERARREREEAEARARRLDALSRREPEAWREVDALIALKKPQEYDRAVALLMDLRDLAVRSGGAGAFESRVLELRELHAKKSTLLKRFEDGGLVG